MTHGPTDDDDRPDWEKVIRPRFSAAEDKSGEGARPSSLIPVHKLSAPDPLYDLQLMRDLKIANEQAVHEFGSLSPDSLQWKSRPNVPITDDDDEDETMHLRQIATTAALAAGTLACNLAIPAAGLANASDQGKAGHIKEMGAASGESANATVPTLGPEYKNIETFSDFRKKLIADGWRPVANPHCIEEVIGTGYKDYCNEYPGRIECRVCDMVPEIFIYTSQGYLAARYIKNGTPLYVGAYGDIQDLDDPGRYGLVVDTWGYKALD